MSVDRTRQLIEEGGRRSKALKFLISHPNEILTTILVWNNLFNSVVASLVTSVVSQVYQNYAVALAAGSATLIILIFGEITPKAFARNHAESLVYLVVNLLKIFYFILWIVIVPLSLIIKKMLGKNAHLRGRVVTTDDIEYLVNRAEEDQSIDAKHIDLINSILEFPTIKVKDIMTPRSKVDAIPLRASDSEILHMIKEHEHSRYPVFQDDLDNILGFIHVKDYFLRKEENDQVDLADLLMPPFFVYERMKIQTIFDYMNRRKVHMALVKDEAGTVVGMITLEDIMEEIFGEINDEHDEESTDTTLIKQVGEGLVVPGNTSLRELFNEYEIEIPLSDSYSTITGFLLELLSNHFPKQGQRIYWEEYSFELSRVTNYQIDEVTIKKIRQGDESDQNDAQVAKNKSSDSSKNSSSFLSSFYN